MPASARAVEDGLPISDPQRQESPVAEMPYSRQEIVKILRRTGYVELADEAERVLPDPVNSDQLRSFAAPHGVSIDDLISEMGGSP